MGSTKENNRKMDSDDVAFEAFLMATDLNPEAVEVQTDRWSRVFVENTKAKSRRWYINRRGFNR